MTENSSSRREFLAAMGALSAAGFAPASVVKHDEAVPEAAARPIVSARGLAAAPEDFTFAPGLKYLQTGSLGPTPRPVMESTIAAWKQLELNPAFYGYGEHEGAMEKVRGQAAALLGCKTEELVLTRSTTDGLNWVAQGMSFKSGDRILTTDQEHPGGRVCWDHVARRHGLVIDVIAIPPGENDAGAIVDRMSRAMTARTRVLSFAHVLSSTGLRMPVADLSQLARSRGCFAVVDGAQAVGGIAVNVKALGCHVYATSGHKWMLGPKGTGLLFLSEELGTAIDPIALQGGRLAYSSSSGVTSIPSVIGLGAAMQYLSAIGIPRIEAHNLALRNRLHSALQTVPQLRVVSSPSGTLASPLLTYTLPESVESGALRERMRVKHNIELKIVPKQWLNGHRVSTHLFNTDPEVDFLVASLRAELA